MTEDIDLIIQGYRKFKKQYYGEKEFAFNELVKNGQKPKFLVIACSDSRVDPAIIMNSQPGDLFVIRNVANLVPPYEEDNGYHGTSAALEFGVNVLGIKHIIILGHSECGGITRLIENKNYEPKAKSFIDKWIELAKPAYNQASSDETSTSIEILLPSCIRYSLLNSLNNLKTFPWIMEKIQGNQLTLHAWYFDLLSGSIKAFSQSQNLFVELDQALEVV